MTGDALHQAAKFCTRMMQRVFLSYILENCVQIYVQVIVFAIGRLMGMRGHRQQLFSILLSIGMTGIKLLDIIACLNVIRHVNGLVATSKLTKTWDTVCDRAK